MMFKSKSTSSLLHESHPRVYPADASQYELLEDCGVGVSKMQPRRGAPGALLCLPLLQSFPDPRVFCTWTIAHPLHSC